MATETWQELEDLEYILEVVWQIPEKRRDLEGGNVVKEGVVRRVRTENFD